MPALGDRHGSCFLGVSSRVKHWLILTNDQTGYSTLKKSLFCQLSALEYSWKYFRIRFMKILGPSPSTQFSALFFCVWWFLFAHSLIPSPTPPFALRKHWGSHYGDSKINKGVSPVRTVVIQGRRQVWAEMTPHSQEHPQEQISAMIQETPLLPAWAGQGSGFAVGAAESTVTSTNFIREKAVSFSSSKIWIIPWTTTLNICANLCLFAGWELKARK